MWMKQGLPTVPAMFQPEQVNLFSYDLVKRDDVSEKAA